jgi:site-specific recombinase XerD
MAPFTLPSDAQGFLQTAQGARAERVVRRFHRWMKAQAVLPAGLALEDVESFFASPSPRTGPPQASPTDQRILIRYLDWLGDKGQLGFDPKKLSIRRRRPLPKLATQFLKSLEPTHKRSTRDSYQTSLSRFYICLTDHRICVTQLKRAHVEQWLIALSDEGLAPATRLHILIHTRIYLHWLLERNELRADPDHLIRSSDMPKLPTYLPRPLSPKNDAELQQRLDASPHRLHKALLLMRLTGIRIGELASLPRDCVRIDLHGQEFLKVPLGKLNNERLVPIDDRVAAIVRSLQHIHGHTEREYLIDKADGNRVPLYRYFHALTQACEGLESKEPITSHRLRHSYATSMLAAGVSLTSVMRLLGHRDIRMTLRYAAITQETVSKEYFEALPSIESRYRDALRDSTPTTDFDPIKNLSDISHWIRKHLASDVQSQRPARSLLKRLARVQVDLERQIAILDVSRTR